MKSIIPLILINISIFLSLLIYTKPTLASEEGGVGYSCYDACSCWGDCGYAPDPYEVDNSPVSNSGYSGGWPDDPPRPQPDPPSPPAPSCDNWCNCNYCEPSPPCNDTCGGCGGGYVNDCGNYCSQPSCYVPPLPCDNSCDGGCGDNYTNACGTVCTRTKCYVPKCGETGNIACINKSTGKCEDSGFRDKNSCNEGTEIPMQATPGCHKIGSCRPSEPGKCAQNCTSDDGIINRWDYCDCGGSPVVVPQPPPAETCPTYCGYPGGSVADGNWGRKNCGAIVGCPLGGGNGNNNSFVPSNAGANPPAPLGGCIGASCLLGNYFQSKGGSIMTLGGAVSNPKLPSGKVFSKDGEGGSPGIPMGNGASSFGAGSVSSTGWIAGDANNYQGVISDKVQYRYDIDQIKGKIISLVKPEQLIFSNIYNPDDLLKGTPEPDGTYYVQTNDDLVISSNLDLGTSRVVVITEKNAKIDGSIKFDEGGLFAVIARENIEINPNVGGSSTGVDPDGVQPNIEGVFFAQKRFKTGTGNKQLRIDGPVVGIEGVDLERTHTSQYPAEYFVFRPDILMTLPQHLLRRNNLWKEALP